MARRFHPALFALMALIGSPAPAAAADGACSTDVPAQRIDDAEAARLYACVEEAIVAAYRDIAGVPGVPAYRDWTVVSTTPFRSITHGRMFINHIVDPKAEALYRRWEGMRGETLPAGTILAKESFRVAEDGKATVGPLFLMEKAASGEHTRTLGWIYSQIFPDGRVERTGEPGGERMKWCHDCHGAVAHQDAVFFPPRTQRIE